jgi:energy-converting hydrogenase Eha subunit C
MQQSRLPQALPEWIGFPLQLLGQIGREFRVLGGRKTLLLRHAQIQRPVLFQLTAAGFIGVRHQTHYLDYGAAMIAGKRIFERLQPAGHSIGNCQRLLDITNGFWGRRLREAAGAEERAE